jgi:hypothetical protein
MKLMRIFRGQVPVGVLDCDLLELSTSDAGLMALFAEAVNPGMFSLGGPPHGQPEPVGLCADYAVYTKLTAGDIHSLYVFKQFILAKGYTTGDCHEKRS